MDIKAGYKSYLKKYDLPHNDFHINLIRIFVGLFFAWKTMSRDFGFMGIVPEDFFYTYPIQIYGPESFMLTTGVPILMELVTLHWIHWLIPHPSEAVLTALQFILTGLALALATVGRGPYRTIAVSTYLLATYLWGYIFLSGQEVDAMMIYFGILMVLCASSYSDVPLWSLRQLSFVPKNLDAGRTFSAILLVFVVYYGLSGYNKIADISISDWLRYNLSQHVEYIIRIQSYGNYFGSTFPNIFSALIGHSWMNYILVPAVYISHLGVFFIFFKRNWIWKYIIFYTGFHFVTSSVSISFTGYMIIWWILLDWRRVLTRITAGNGNEPATQAGATFTTDAKAEAAAPLPPARSTADAVKAGGELHNSKTPWFRDLPLPMGGMYLAAFLLPLTAAAFVAADWLGLSPIETPQADLIALACFGFAGLATGILGLGRRQFAYRCFSGLWSLKPVALLLYLVVMLLPAAIFETTFVARLVLGIFMLPLVAASIEMYRAYRGAPFMARAFPVAFTIMAAVPGFVLPPYYQGIVGWIEPIRNEDSVTLYGYQLINDEGERIWLTHTIFTPITQLSRFPAAWRNKQDELGPIEPFILKAYRRAYPLLKEGYMPFQRHLGRWAYPPHTFATNLADHAEFPPDRISSIEFVGQTYDKTDRLVDTQVLSQYTFHN